MSLKVNTKEELLDAINANKQTICSFGVKQLGIFGSFARNEATEESDVDFLIDFFPESKTLKNIVGLSNFLQKILARKVEIVTPQSLNKYIGKYIMQEVLYVTLAA